MELSNYIIHDYLLIFAYISMGFCLGASFVAKYVYEPMLDEKHWGEYMAKELPETPFEKYYPLNEICDLFLHPDNINLNNFVCVSTPNGLVFLRYNNKSEGFEYWCNDKNIKYDYLETCARKYIKVYCCKNLYKDRNKIKSDEGRENEEQHENKVDNEDFKNEENNDIFVKKKKTTLDKNKKTNKIANVEGNKYLYKGKLTDFTKENVNIKMFKEKSNTMSFTDFKKKIGFN